MNPAPSICPLFSKFQRVENMLLKKKVMDTVEDAMDDGWVSLLLALQYR